MIDNHIVYKLFVYYSEINTGKVKFFLALTKLGRLLFRFPQPHCSARFNSILVGFLVAILGCFRAELLNVMDESPRFGRHIGAVVYFRQFYEKEKKYNENSLFKVCQRYAFVHYRAPRKGLLLPNLCVGYFYLELRHLFRNRKETKQTNLHSMYVQ